MQIHKTLNNEYYNFKIVSFTDIMNSITHKEDKIIAAKSICNTNGVFMVIINIKNQLKFITDGYFKSVNDVFIGPNVIMIKEFVYDLNEYEIRALRYHEEAHIFYKHYLNVNDSLLSLNGVVFNSSLENEIQADSYASNFAGSWNLLSGMKKNADNSISMFEKINRILLGRKIPEEKLSELKHKMLNNESIIRRFARLGS